ncbi:uncharacterized protein PSFLO_03203 [Pseudozyma flocculosa]|nr:uncharacterized protein PSFLO_03203 [Pseudozyma flocculosa]
MAPRSAAAVGTAATLSLGATASFDSLSAASARATLETYTGLPDARTRVRYAKTVFARLYLLAISRPSDGSVDEGISFLHVLDSESASQQPLPVIGSFKSGLVDFLVDEVRSYIQPLTTPDAEDENRLPESFYAAAMATGLLLGRLFASTPAPHDTSEMSQRIWDSLVEPALIRGLFVDEQAASSAPANVALLPALVASSAASIRSYLLLRTKGRGKQYVWYDDECKQPDAQWTWDDVVAQLQRGFNAPFAPKHTYPAHCSQFWQKVASDLAQTTAKDADALADAKTPDVVAQFAAEPSVLQSEFPATLNSQDRARQLATLLRHTAERVEAKFGVGQGTPKPNTFLSFQGQSFDDDKAKQAHEAVQRLVESLQL